MPLLDEDVARIERLGFRRDMFSYVDERGTRRLRNVEGRCIFLDPTSRECTIYEHRPLGCRIYPVVYVEGLGVSVDGICPARKTVTKREVVRKRLALKKMLTLLGPHQRSLVITDQTLRGSSPSEKDSC